MPSFLTYRKNHKDVLPRPQKYHPPALSQRLFHRTGRHVAGQSNGFGLASFHTARLFCAARAAASSDESQSETGHLPPHDWSALPVGAVRLQARAQKIRRQRLSPGVSRRTTLRLHSRDAANARTGLSLQATRRFRRVDFRPPSRTVKARRQAHLHQNDDHGPVQSRSGPAMVHTGQARLGYPSIGSWVTWGLGTENQNLPGFMVLLSGGRVPRVGKSLWGSGFLPSVYQGVQCRSFGDPVLNTANQKGISRKSRRAALDALQDLNHETYAQVGDPETVTRIAQYEMAFRMQVFVPEVMSIKEEPKQVHEMYGTKPGKESFANNCLLARRLAENGVRFIQLYDWGWDSHGSAKSEALNHGFDNKCKSIDKPISALLTDLEQRGMLDDTLVVWGGEFGRTPMQENRNGAKMAFLGRDHNPNAFTIWMAGAGIKPGVSYGETDPMGYLSMTNPVGLHDFHATLLHLVGFDHHKLSKPFQGLNQKLTGVKESKILKDILS